MLRKILLTAILLMFLAPAAFAGGGGGDFDLPQMTQHIVKDDDGMSPDVLAALIAGGLGLTGAVITAIVLIDSRRRRKE